MLLIAEIELVEHQGSPFEFVLLAIGGLLTLALLTGFIILMIRSRPRK